MILREGNTVQRNSSTQSSPWYSRRQEILESDNNIPLPVLQRSVKCPDHAVLSVTTMRIRCPSTNQNQMFPHMRLKANDFTRIRKFVNVFVHRRWHVAVVRLWVTINHGMMTMH